MPQYPSGFEPDPEGFTPDKKPGLLSKIYSSIFNAPKIVTEPARKFAESITEPELEPSFPRIKGFIGGAAEGLASQLSPANILTLGRGRLPQLAAKILGGTQVLHGGSEITQGNIAEGLGDIGFGTLMGISGLKSRIPSIGKKIADDVPIRDVVTGDIPKGREIIPGPLPAPASIGGPQFNPRGRTGMTGNIQKKGPVITDLPEPTPDLISRAQANGPNYIILKSPTPELVKRARQYGYKLDSITPEGKVRMIKTTDIVAPILESEVGITRPTPSAARQQLGSIADIRKQSLIAEALNFPRGIMASWDFSAPLRQGLPLIHKKEWWTSFDDMFKAWGSENTFQQIQKSILDKPLFKPRIGPGKKILPSFAEDAGLKLTDLTDLSRREEAIMSTWAEKVPGVRRSNRAYVSFLNKLRADTFEKLIQQGKVFGANGEANVPLARALADFVNTSTGRGSLGKLESSAVALNSTFFSPRLIASRLKMLNPAYYVMADPFVRKEALKSLFAVAGTGSMVGQLSKMAGATVESDPTSSDFGKIKIGNIRMDPFAGFQQYIVLANRLMQGRIKSSITGREYNLGEKFGRPTRLDVIGRFAEGKLHPVLSFATGILRGKDFTGQPFNVPEEIAKRFVPIFIQDLKELATENPDILSLPEDINFENLPLALPAAFGMSVQQYESR